MIGDPHAVPYCTLAQLTEHRCPPDSQVGYLWNVLYEAFFFSPIYNVEPDTDQAGLLGFEFPFTNSTGVHRTQCEDRQRLWPGCDGEGYYADRSSGRGADHPLGGSRRPSPQCIPHSIWSDIAATHTLRRSKRKDAQRPCTATGAVSTAPRVPFLDNPTACGEPLTSRIEMLAYDGGFSEDFAPYAATTGCDQLSFNPSLSAQPTTGRGGHPVGTRSRSERPAGREPRSPLTIGDSRSHGEASRRLLDQPQCRRWQDRVHRLQKRGSGPPKKLSAPKLRRSARSRSTVRPSRAPIPGFVYLLSPQTG